MLLLDGLLHIRQFRNEHLTVHLSCNHDTCEIVNRLICQISGSDFAVRVYDGPLEARSSEMSHAPR
jgi:hypothetical protein